MPRRGKCRRCRTSCPCWADRVCANAAELNVPLLIHPQIPQTSIRDTYYAGFGAPIDLALSTFALGWHFEAGIQFVRLILGGVFDRHPNLQVILSKRRPR
nr:amidohydrolase family protein [Rhizobium sp. NZLR3b]